MYVERRQRRLIRFTLDERKPAHAEMWEWLLDRKALREMAPTIIKALRLYRALMDGDTSLLFEMFPALQAQMHGDVNARLTALESRILQPPANAPPLLLKTIATDEQETKPREVVESYDEEVNKRAIEAMKNAFL